MGTSTPLTSCARRRTFGLRSVALPISAAQTTHWVVHHCGGNKTTLVQGAWAAARAKTGYLHSQFLRLKSRRGPKKAIIAVAASMLTAAYYMLRNGVDYRDLGADHFDRTDRVRTANRLVKRLGQLGYSVEIKEAA